MMELLHKFSEGVEWVEERSKPLFVIVALLLYVVELVRLAGEYSPIQQLDAYLVQALGALSVPFGIILLQEMLELIGTIADSNLLSARRQFEIVLLVIVRSFFKKFEKVSGYVADGEFSSTVQEALVKIVAIIVFLALIFAFRRITESDLVRRNTRRSNVNLVKQALVVLLALFVLINMLVVDRAFDDGEFIKLVFTGIIIIEAIFLIIEIAGDYSFAQLAFDASLIIALIFARFPLFTSNTLSYILSTVGVTFATLALFILYRAALDMQARNPDGIPPEPAAPH